MTSRWQRSHSITIYISDIFVLFWYRSMWEYNGISGHVRALHRMKWRNHTDKFHQSTHLSMTSRTWQVFTVGLLRLRKRGRQLQNTPRNHVSFRHLVYDRWIWLNFDITNQLTCLDSNKTRKVNHYLWHELINAGFKIIIHFLQHNYLGQYAAPVFLISTNYRGWND